MIEGPRMYYKSLIVAEEDAFSPWKLVKEELLWEATNTRGAKLLSNSEESFNRRVGERKIIKKLLASEIFPDRKPIEMIKAENEFEIHQDLREKFPSSESRLSGEIIMSEVGDFFVFDAFFVKKNKKSTLITPTETSLEEILNFILDQGYIPVDAMFTVIPSSTQINHF